MHYLTNYLAPVLALILSALPTFAATAEIISHLQETATEKKISAGSGMD